MRSIIVTSLIVLLGNCLLSCDNDSVCPKVTDGVFEVDSIFPTFYIESDGGQIYTRLHCRYVYHFEKHPGSILHVYMEVPGVRGVTIDSSRNITNIYQPKEVDVMFEDSRGAGLNMDYSYLEYVDVRILFEGLCWEWEEGGREFDERKFYGSFSWADTIRVPVNNRL